MNWSVVVDSAALVHTGLLCNAETASSECQTWPRSEAWPAIIKHCPRSCVCWCFFHGYFHRMNTARLFFCLFVCFQATMTTRLWTRRTSCRGEIATRVDSVIVCLSCRWIYFPFKFCWSWICLVRTCTFSTRAPVCFMNEIILQWTGHNISHYLHAQLFYLSVSVQCILGKKLNFFSFFFLTVHCS